MGAFSAIPMFRRHRQFACLLGMSPLCTMWLTNVNISLSIVFRRDYRFTLKAACLKLYLLDCFYCQCARAAQKQLWRELCLYCPVTLASILFPPFCRETNSQSGKRRCDEGWQYIRLCLCTGRSPRFCCFIEVCLYQLHYMIRYWHTLLSY